MAAEMSIDGRWAPHPSPPAKSCAAALALLVPCGFCWAEPGTPCTDAGQHYARFLRIYRRGIMDADGLITVSRPSHMSQRAASSQTRKCLDQPGTLSSAPGNASENHAI
jgi:hypothetical protein